MTTLRIRPDNGTIRELNIPKEILEVLEKIVFSPKTTEEVKKIMIKRFAKVSPCCVCDHPNLRGNLSTGGHQ